MYRRIVPAIVAGAALTLSACGSSDGGSSATDANGVKTGAGVTDTQINVGLLTDYSGPLAEGATSGSLGAELKFDEVNAAGGVCGRKIVAVKEDTKYDPLQTVQAYRAISKKVVMISELLGTGSVEAIKTQIERDAIPALAISMNTATLEKKGVYVPLPVFEVELMNGLAWAAEQAKASDSNPIKVGVVTGADDYGKDYLDAVEHAAEALPGVEIVAKPTFAYTDKDFTAQVSELKDKGAEYVLLGTAPQQTAGLVGTSAQLGYEPTWVASSGAWYVALATPLKGLLDKFYVSAGYGTEVDKVKGVEDLNAAIAKYSPDSKPTNFMIAGWLFGIATVDALEAACDSKDLTREGITAALKDLKISYDGLAGDADLKDGDTIASYSSRMNTVGADGSLQPVNDFVATEAAKSWDQNN